MDDLSAMLSQLLDSPDGLDKIKSLAGSLLNNQPAAQQQAEEPAPQNQLAPSIPALSGAEIGTIMTLVNSLKNDTNDERAKLLLALRPHLKEDRRHRVDEAVKLLKIISLAPLISQAGLFDMFK